MGCSQQRCKKRAKNVQNQAYGKTEKYTRIDPLKNVQKYNRLEKSQEQTVHWKSETSHIVTIYEQKYRYKHAVCSQDLKCSEKSLGKTQNTE